MPSFEIMTYPNPILRKKAKDVQNISSDQREILDRMSETMYQNEAVGLAAEQINLDTKLIVVDARDKRGLMKLINPVIKNKEDIEYMEEGCLSLPGMSVLVPRAKKITIEAKNERGENITIDAEGFLARVLQHEIDHLNGKVIMDYLNPLKKSFLLFKYHLKRFIKK